MNADTLDLSWRGYTLDTDEAEAAASFERRYGQPPERIVEAGGNLLVGPVPEVNARAKQLTLDAFTECLVEPSYSTAKRRDATNAYPKS